jgi:putative hemolysin
MLLLQRGDARICSGVMSVAETLESAAESGARPPVMSLRRGRDLGRAPQTLACAGALEARLATTRAEIHRAQRLRYRVFFEEGGAIPAPAARLARRDLCRFDPVCDHLIVVDHATKGRGGAPKVVGVYRLLRQDVADSNFGFYSAGEFDVEALIRRRPHTRFLELGRACIAPTHRGRRVLELLWRGVWAYARHHRIDALIGCVSLPGVDARAHAASAATLAIGGDPAWRVAPRPELAVQVGEAPLRPADLRSLSRVLPPLAKGYWRLGATFSPQPVVDRVFGTTDLFVALPLADVEERYLDYFGVEAVAAPLAA